MTKRLSEMTPTELAERAMELDRRYRLADRLLTEARANQYTPSGVVYWHAHRRAAQHYWALVNDVEPEEGA